MRGFYCIDQTGRICGRVEAVDGDAAWLLAKSVNPRVDHLRPA